MEFFGFEEDNEKENIRPLIILDSMVVLPGMRVHLELSEQSDIAGVEYAMTKDGRIFVTLGKTEKKGKTENTAGGLSINDFYQTGIVGRVERLSLVSEKCIHVLVEGLTRANVLEMETKKGGPVFVKLQEVEEALPAKRDVLRYKAMRRECMELAEQYFGRNRFGQIREALSLDEVEKLGDFLDLLAGNLPIGITFCQEFLEEENIMKRYEMLADILRKEIVTERIRQELSERLSNEIEANQREYILREQMQFIKKELDKNDEEESEEEKYLHAVEKLEASEDVKNTIAKEIKRLEQMSSSSSDAATQRIYIETLLELPWDKTSEENISLSSARKVMDEDHYGMDEIKKRIVEFLAVRALTGETQSTILCLVGPPGTGKTSIAKSVAKATGKEYVRVCLGGVRDEAEIRGHRRTYIGAMPGRICNGLCQAGVKNPLMLLDEIDKMSSDYKGDVASAMLEVLDSEQNCNFRDHYVEIPMDLSKVMFIATANTLDTIPRPLMDRMEIIEVSGYTENEKFHIAKDYLFPKVYEKNGMNRKQIRIQDGALREIIGGYTREAGVRELQRTLDKICRKVVTSIVDQREQSGSTVKPEVVVIKKSDLPDYLGKKKYENLRRNAKAEVGVVRGLAWTSVGGDTLEVETGIVPGKGEVKLTGQMGDVMKESAMTAISYLRSIAGDYGIAPEFFKEHDIHIHIPEGAIPKDGPSAGITMATAVFSAMTGKKVRPEVAMTGEITLRGRVLPIGGLKEKLLAAKLAGIKLVCVPAKNEKDVEEIPEEIKTGMEIVYVETLAKVLEQAIQ